MKRLAWAYLLAASALVPACSPWHYGSGDFYAGTVDPAKYPAIYTGGGSKTASGVFAYIDAATLSSAVVRTYMLDIPADQTGGADDTGIPELTLALSDVDFGADGVYSPLPGELAYTFDASANEPVASPAVCAAPSNYVFDYRLEAYRKDFQGPVFSTIPQTGASFVPFWREVAVQSKSGYKCQTVKDEEQIMGNKELTVPITPADPEEPGSVDAPTPSGKYLAMYPVDPRANVLPGDPAVDSSQAAGIWGSQKWGWYKHFLFAYIDGGYIPTQQISIDLGDDQSVTFTGMRPQKWFFPATYPSSVEDPDTGDITFPIDPDTNEYTFVDSGGPGLSNNAPELGGAITDLLEAARGEAGYSPICELCPYEGSTSDWQAFLEDGNPLPLFGNQATATCSGVYVYCPQQAQ